MDIRTTYIDHRSSLWKCWRNPSSVSPPPQPLLFHSPLPLLPFSPPGSSIREEPWLLEPHQRPWQQSYCWSHKCPFLESQTRPIQHGIQILKRPKIIYPTYPKNLSWPVHRWWRQPQHWWQRNVNHDVNDSDDLDGNLKTRLRCLLWWSFYWTLHGVF